MHITILTQNSQLDSIAFFKSFLMEHEISIKSDASSVINIIRNHGMDYKDNDLDFLERVNTKFLNPPLSLRLLRDKFEVYKFLKSLNLNHLNTTLDYKELSFPMIMKTLRGMKGLGVYLVHDEDELLKIKGEDSRFIFQDYVRDKKEYRYIYFLKEHLFLKNQGGNFKRQEQYQKTQLPSEWLNLFEKIRIKLGLNFFALDCFEHSEELYIIDINGVCGTKLLQQHISPSKLLKCQGNLSLF